MGKIDQVFYVKQLLDIIEEKNILFFCDLVVWCRNNDDVLFSFLVNYSSSPLLRIFIASRFYKERRREIG